MFRPVGKISNCSSTNSNSTNQDDEFGTSGCLSSSSKSGSRSRSLECNGSIVSISESSPTSRLSVGSAGKSSSSSPEVPQAQFTLADWHEFAYTTSALYSSSLEERKKRFLYLSGAQCCPAIGCAGHHHSETDLHLISSSSWCSCCSSPATISCCGCSFSSSASSSSSFCSSSPLSSFSSISLSLSSDESSSTNEFSSSAAGNCSRLQHLSSLKKSGSCYELQRVTCNGDEKLKVFCYSGMRWPVEGSCSTAAAEATKTRRSRCFQRKCLEQRASNSSYISLPVHRKLSSKHSNPRSPLASCVGELGPRYEELKAFEWGARSLSLCVERSGAGDVMGFSCDDENVAKSLSCWRHQRQAEGGRVLELARSDGSSGEVVGKRTGKLLLKVNAIRVTHSDAADVTDAQLVEAAVAKCLSGEQASDDIGGDQKLDASYSQERKPLLPVTLVSPGEKEKMSKEKEHQDSEREESDEQEQELLGASNAVNEQLRPPAALPEWSKVEQLRAANYLATHSLSSKQTPHWPSGTNELRACTGKTSTSLLSLVASSPPPPPPSRPPCKSQSRKRVERHDRSLPAAAAEMEKSSIREGQREKRTGAQVPELSGALSSPVHTSQLHAFYLHEFVLSGAASSCGKSGSSPSKWASPGGSDNSGAKKDDEEDELTLLVSDEEETSELKLANELAEFQLRFNCAHCLCRHQLLMLLRSEQILNRLALKIKREERQANLIGEKVSEQHNRCNNCREKLQQQQQRKAGVFVLNPSDCCSNESCKQQLNEKITRENSDNEEHEEDKIQMDGDLQTDEQDDAETIDDEDDEDVDDDEGDDDADDVDDDEDEDVNEEEDEEEEEESDEDDELSANEPDDSDEIAAEADSSSSYPSSSSWQIRLAKLVDTEQSLHSERAQPASQAKRLELSNISRAEEPEVAINNNLLVLQRAATTIPISSSVESELHKTANVLVECKKVSDASTRRGMPLWIIGGPTAGVSKQTKRARRSLKPLESSLSSVETSNATPAHAFGGQRQRRPAVSGASVNLGSQDLWTAHRSTSSPTPSFGIARQAAKSSGKILQQQQQALSGEFASAKITGLPADQSQQQQQPQQQAFQNFYKQYFNKTASKQVNPEAASRAREKQQLFPPAAGNFFGLDRTDSTGYMKRRSSSSSRVGGTTPTPELADLRGIAGASSTVSSERLTSGTCASEEANWPPGLRRRCALLSSQPVELGLALAQLGVDLDRLSVDKQDFLR